MAYKGAVMVDDETLFKTMQVADETGALVMVHAENGDAIDIIVKEAVAEGKTEPIWHARTRPMETEAEATNRAIQLARVAGAPLYVVHVSCQPAIEPIAARAREGLGRLRARPARSTCSSTTRRSTSPDFEGGKYIYTPPPRPKEHQEHLWKALRHRRPLGRLHRPLPVQLAGAEGDQRPRTSRSSRTAGRGSRTGCTCCTSSASAPGGSRMNRFVELTSTNVAKLFGLYPRKGTIAPGSDADIVVWDPEKTADDLGRRRTTRT